MSVSGKTAVGANTYTLALNDLRIALFNFGNGGYVAKVSAYLDGLGPGVGDQEITAIAFNSAGGALIAYSYPTVVAHGSPAAWRDFVFPGSGLDATAVQNFAIALWAGPAGSVARVYGDDPGLGGLGGNYASVVYAGGVPPTVPPSATTLTADMSIYATHYGAYVAPRAPDGYYRDLPVKEGQEALYGSARTGSVLSARCGWHGTALDPAVPNAAVVRRDGPLAGLIGQRVRVSALTGGLTRRSCFAYVHTDSSALPVEWDLSLPRRLFLELDELARDSIPVSVAKVT